MPLGAQTGKSTLETICGINQENCVLQKSIFQGQTSSIPFAYYHFARDKLEDYREAKARAETLLLEAEVVSS